MVTGIEVKVVETAVSLAKDLVGFLLGEVKDKRARERAQDALTYALGMEVSELVIAIARRHHWWTTRPVDVDPWLPPLVPFHTEVFDQARARIETLPTELVPSVVRFYGYVRFLNAEGGTLDAYRAAKHEAEFRATYTHALETLLEIAYGTLSAFMAYLKSDSLPDPLRAR